MDRISLTIDGQQVTVPPRTTILLAAEMWGIDIPHLCFEPGMRPTSTCRLCLVEVKGMPSLVASCVYEAANGMEVITKSENLDKVRRTILELLLSNHPADCLTCEKNGECMLQKYAYEMGVERSPYEGEKFEHAPEEANPVIERNFAKCILCGRCITVCQEMQVNQAIDYSHRGFATHVTTPFDQPRDLTTCAYCGNCVQVCPVGALTPKMSVRKGRIWNQKITRSVCTYCGVGCGIKIHSVGNEIVKISGDENGPANHGLLCVKGRFGYDFVHSPDRLTTPLIRKTNVPKDAELDDPRDAFRAATWDEALDLVAARLGEIKAKHGPDSLAGLSSAKCTNEDNYVMQRFVRAALGTNNIEHCARLCHAATVAGLAVAFGSGAMTNSITETEGSDAILVIGSNTTEAHPIIGSAIKRAVANNGAKLIVADPREIELVRFAAKHLCHKPGSDVALLNGLMNVIISKGLEKKDFINERTESYEQFKAAVERYTPEFVEKVTGVAAQDIVEAAEIYGKAKAASIFYSMGITQHSTGTDNVRTVANLAMLTGNLGRENVGVNPLRGQNNVQGACDVGALCNVYPGYLKVDDPAVRAKFEAAYNAQLSPKPGLTVTEIIPAAEKGDIKAIYVMGENPVLSDPDIGHVKEALKKLDFLVVQDIVLSETAEFADVVLPTTSFAEKDGTFTNTERRVQRVRKAIEAPGQARLDWEIVCDVSRRMGYPMQYNSWEDILREIASVTPIYGGILPERLEQGTLQWPCPSPDHPGTRFLHKDKFTRGKGLFAAVEFIPPAEWPSDEYPLILTTGRVLEHWHTGTMTRRSKGLATLYPAGVVEINPADAAEREIEDGDLVTVSTRRGKVTVNAQVTRKPRPGTIFMAFHFKETAANLLTNPALDPVAKIPEYKVAAAQVEKMAEDAVGVA